ncbi:cobalt-precorrin 5A hydrolase [Clostridium sp. Marseille-Q2269]|uniref:cobalt-precorrin 5A hydrolase n=1 Tax=Clostridium sp. Marseille-Q2269 TaxID=2942205 RepID=UPI0020738982|nr:cobalt-precorrin 5A hydrolase [Clostridium sp. Marseille-Q2269]
MGNYIAYNVKNNMDVDIYSKYIKKILPLTNDFKYKGIYLLKKYTNLPHEKNYLNHKNSKLVYNNSYLNHRNLNLLHKKMYFKDEKFNLKEIVEKAFANYEAIIFISSTGIAVRAIAPFIKSKDKDPAVIVIDSTGKYVISLLSGHLGGANELTENIAKILEAEPVITTATDNLNIKAPDIIAKENDLVIEDLKKAKDISALLVNGEKVAFVDEENLVGFPKGYIHNIEDAKGVVLVTSKDNVEKYLINKARALYLNKFNGDNSEEKNIKDYKKTKLRLKHWKMEDNNKYLLQNQSLNLNLKSTLKLVRKNIVLGIGCKKNYDENEMRENVIRTLKEENIDLNSVNSIVSVEIKKDEKALIELSKFLNCPLIIYNIEELKKVEHKFKGSDFVRKTIGVGSVCEPCIELKGGKIIKEKQKLNGMTLAIGKL